MTWIGALTCHSVGKPWEHYANWKRPVTENSVSLRQLSQIESLATSIRTEKTLPQGSAEAHSRVRQSRVCLEGWTLHQIALVGSECTELLSSPIQRHKTSDQLTRTHFSLKQNRLPQSSLPWVSWNTRPPTSNGSRGASLPVSETFFF